MAGYHCGLKCIIDEIKGGQVYYLKFELNGKQFTTTYKIKENVVSRGISKLLSPSDALKASIWNVVSGPPGLGCRSRYVTDIWKPTTNDEEKLRLPEPTFSVVCKILYLMGKDFFVCDLGRHFPKDIILLPRNLVFNALGNAWPKFGDYLLVSTLVIWELLDGVEVSRMIPLWAYWDSSNCSLDSTAVLNLIERGPEHSALHIPDQIPCMWGVVQEVSKKSLKVYVPCINSSAVVPKHAVFQHEGNIVEEDWLQLWLTPQANQRGCDRLVEVSAWNCSHCCWAGRATYDTYLERRLGEHYVKHAAQVRPQPEQDKATVKVGDGNTRLAATQNGIADGGIARPAATASGKVGGDVVRPSTTTTSKAGDDTGVGKVLEVKERSGSLRCERGSACKVGKHVFHMGLMSVFGVKMASIPGVKMTELVEAGSTLGYRMNHSNHQLRAVWVGPEVVSLERLDFLPQMSKWVALRRLRDDVVQKMLKSIMDNLEAVSKKNAAAALSTEATKGTKGEPASDPAIIEAVKGAVDGQDDSAQSEEGWSVDSNESEVDELEPLPPLTVSGLQEHHEGSDTQVSAVLSSEEAAQEVALGEISQPGTGQVESSVEMVNDNTSPMLMLVLVELTKFLCKEFVEKGKLTSVAEACEVSADFVARLEKALEANENGSLVGPSKRSVGLQTD